jgi:hypothetical protein
LGDDESNVGAFSCLEEMMRGFSYVRYAEERREPELNLDFGRLEAALALKVREFWDEHNRRHGSYEGAAGGRYGWKITPTGLGTFIVTVCHSCKEELDVSDTDSW